MSTNLPFIWQAATWPAMHYDPMRVAGELAHAHRAQGVVEGKLASLGFEQRLALAAEAWSQDAVATAAIEGPRCAGQALVMGLSAAAGNPGREIRRSGRRHWGS